MLVKLDSSVSQGLPQLIQQLLTQVITSDLVQQAITAPNKPQLHKHVQLVTSYHMKEHEQPQSASLATLECIVRLQVFQSQLEFVERVITVQKARLQQQQINVQLSNIAHEDQEQHWTAQVECIKMKLGSITAKCAQRGNTAKEGLKSSARQEPTAQAIDDKLLINSSNEVFDNLKDRIDQSEADRSAN